MSQNFSIISSEIEKEQKQDNNSPLPPYSTTYKTYPYRWLIFTWFWAMEASYGITAISFGPIIPLLSDLYSVSLTVATSLAVIYSIVFVPVNFIANKIIDSKGLAFTIHISSAFGLVGWWLRMTGDSFWCLLAGQLFNAVGMTFVQTLGATFAGTWFADNERAMVTTVTSLSISLGGIFGLFLTESFMSDNDAEDLNLARDKFFKYLFYQSIIVTCLMLPNVFVIRKQPKTPPSRSAEKYRLMCELKSKNLGFGNNFKTEDENRKKTYIQSLKTLLKDWNFWYLNISYTFLHGMIYTVGSTMGVVSHNFGYSSSANSNFGIGFMTAGILCSFVHAAFLDKYRKF